MRAFAPRKDGQLQPTVLSAYAPELGAEQAQSEPAQTHVREVLPVLVPELGATRAAEPEQAPRVAPKPVLALTPSLTHALESEPVPVLVQESGSVRGLREPDAIRPASLALSEALLFPAAIPLPVLARVLPEPPELRAFHSAGQRVLNLQPAQIPSNASQCAAQHESFPRSEQSFLHAPEQPVLRAFRSAAQHALNLQPAQIPSNASRFAALHGSFLRSDSFPPAQTILHVSQFAALPDWIPHSALSFLSALESRAAAHARSVPRLIRVSPHACLRCYSNESCLFLARTPRSGRRPRRASLPG